MFNYNFNIKVFYRKILAGLFLLLFSTGALLSQKAPENKEPEKTSQPESQPVRSKSGYDWSRSGVRVLNRSEFEGRQLIRLQDSAGQNFQVSSDRDLTREDAKNILKYVKVFNSWTGLSIRRLEFFIFDANLDILVVPTALTYENTDLGKLVQTGLKFSFAAGALEYNFRIQVNKFFVKITGLYTDQAEICGKLLEAKENPRDYIRKRDPEFLLRKLEAMEKRLEEQKLNQFRLRMAVITLHNTGFFSGPSAVNAGEIKKLVELKLKNPGLTAEQLATRAQQSGIKLSSKEIKLVLMVYFNSF